MRRSNSNAFLIAGALIGPLFYAIVLGQLLTRAGFSIRIHPISLLELGQHGWIQVVNFAICGALALVFAIGLFRRGASHLLASLFGMFGLGFLIVAAFPPDPFMGFPPGAPVSVAQSQSAHAKLHGLGFLVMFVPLMIACFVVALKERKQSHDVMSASSLATGLAIPAILALGLAESSFNSEAFILLGVVTFGWVSCFAVHLLRCGNCSPNAPITSAGLSQARSERYSRY